MRFAELDAVTVDGYGTLVRLLDPVPSLVRSLAERGFDRGPELVHSAFATEVAYYRPEAIRGRDLDSLARLRCDCTRVFLDAAGIDLEPEGGERPCVPAGRRVGLVVRDLCEECGLHDLLRPLDAALRKRAAQRGHRVDEADECPVPVDGDGVELSETHRDGAGGRSRPGRRRSRDPARAGRRRRRRSGPRGSPAASASWGRVACRRG